MNKLENVNIIMATSQYKNKNLNFKNFYWRQPSFALNMLGQNMLDILLVQTPSKWISVLCTKVLTKNARFLLFLEPPLKLETEILHCLKV